MNIVLIGATGLVGSELLNRLLLNQRVRTVTTITRRKIENGSSKLVQLVLPQLTCQTIEALELNADIFLCGLGTTIKTAGSQEAFSVIDHDLVVSFAKLAERSNAIALFVVSALGANPKSRVFYNRVKGHMEQDISLCKINSIYILKPSLLIGDRKESRPAEALGISIYKFTEKIIPPVLKRKLGTKVLDIVSFVDHELDNLKSGRHVITDFQQSSL